LGIVNQAEIVKPESEQLSELNSKMAELVARSSMKVLDGQTCLEAKLLESDFKGYLRAVELSDFGRDYEAKKEAYQRSRDRLTALSSPAEGALKMLTTRRRAWEEEERQAAAREQARINEEARRVAAAKAEEERKVREKEIEKQRKAGEIGKREAEKQKQAAAVEEQRRAAEVQEVRVAPSIPKVAGVPSRQNWKFEIVDANKIPRRYLVPDESAIGYMVRTSKDAKKAEAECPGLRVWSE
jgi:flagellar biosynthesis GTPase FlhF